MTVERRQDASYFYVEYFVVAVLLLLLFDHIVVARRCTAAPWSCFRVVDTFLIELFFVFYKKKEKTAVTRRDYRRVNIIHGQQFFLFRRSCGESVDHALRTSPTRRFGNTEIASFCLQRSAAQDKKADTIRFPCDFRTGWSVIRSVMPDVFLFLFPGAFSQWTCEKKAPGRLYGPTLVPKITRNDWVYTLTHSVKLTILFNGGVGAISVKLLGVLKFYFYI